MIDVKLFATLREGREKQYLFEADGISAAADILARLGIPAGDVSILLVNGRHSKPADPVKDGDLVALFPPSGGG